MDNAYTNNPLSPKLPTEVKPGTEDVAVLSAIDCIYKGWEEKNIRDSKNLLIQNLLEEGFSVADPTGTRKIEGYVLQQAFWRTANRMKPLDFELHASGRPQAQETIVTAAVGQVMEDGGYLSALRDKGGAYNYSLLFGDAFVSVGTNEENDATPISFIPLANTNVYVDSYATVMRGGGPGRSVSRMVIIQSMSWSDVLQWYPEAEKKKAGTGAIPRDLSFMKETGRSFSQNTELDNDYTEVAHYYDIANKCYTRFIGSACTVTKKLAGDAYPFIKNKKPYIPVLHFMCWPSVEGFWNHGLGDILYKLTVVTRRLLNMAEGHVEDNTYPISLINVPNQGVSKFFNDLMSAYEMRAAGKKGYVAMEYDPSNPNSGRVSADQLLTQSLMSEWQMLFERLDVEIQRLGINLNDIEAGSNVTATQIMLEEESSNAFVKQIGEYNASEYKFAVELTMDLMKKFIKKTNKTVVHIPGKVKAEGEEVEMKDITLGAVADELRKFDYFVKVNARTGAIPSGTLQTAQIARVMQFAQPGTPAFSKLSHEMAQLMNRDLSEEDFLPPAPEMSAPPGSGIGSAPIPTETDRETIDPRMDQPEPAF